MKQSKIYLVITACLLALIGFAAARAHKFSQHIPGCFGTWGAGNDGLDAFTCLHKSVPWYTQGISPAVTGYYLGLKFPVYTQCFKGPCGAARLFVVKIGS